jgi:hypothetical protein
MEIKSLNKQIGTLLDKEIKLDSYSKAHLQELSAYIEKVLNAEITLNGGSGGGMSSLMMLLGGEKPE